MKEKPFNEFLLDLVNYMIDQEEQEKKDEVKEEDLPEGMTKEELGLTFAEVLMAFEAEIAEGGPVTLWAQHIAMPENVFLTYKYEVGWDEKGNQFIYPNIILGSETEEDPEFDLENYLLGYGWHLFRQEEDEDDEENENGV